MSTNKISWTSSAYPNYENYEKRLNTYFERFWPVSIRQNGMMMAKAGFFLPRIRGYCNMFFLWSLFTQMVTK